MAQARDVGVYFYCWKLAAFAGFGTLRHFDLEFVGAAEIFGGDAEARGGDLFYAIGGFGFETIETGIFAAFTGIAARAKTIHGDR